MKSVDSVSTSPEIRNRMEEVVRTVGPWSGHNIDLGDGVTTIDYGVLLPASLRGVGFEWRNIDVKTRYGNGNASGPDYQENRLITTYTFKF